MSITVQTQEVFQLPAAYDVLLEASLSEGYQFLTRLKADWHTSANKFDQPGECLLVVSAGDDIAGIGGLNKDPYSPPDTPIGRIRHLYVLPEFRKFGIGRMLVSSLLKRAEDSFGKVNLRVADDAGARFYETLNFKRSADAYATHAIIVNPTLLQLV